MSKSIGLGRMHHTIWMFWGRIDGEQFQSLVAGISEIMFGSGGYHKHVAGSNLVRLVFYDGLSRTFDENKHLVNSIMDFPANVFTWKNTHQDYLRVFVREEDLPKVIILKSQLLHIVVLHTSESPFSLIQSAPFTMQVRE